MTFPSQKIEKVRCGSPVGILTGSLLAVVASLTVGCGSAERSTAQTPDAKTTEWLDLLDRVDELESTDRAEEALAAIDEALVPAPKAATLLQRRAELLVALDRDEEALRAIEAVLTVDDGIAFTHELHAEQLLKQGRVEESLQALERCLELDPSLTAMCTFVAYHLEKRQQEDAATRALELGLAADPRWWKGHRLRSELLWDRGLREEALQGVEAELAARVQVRTRFWEQTESKGLTDEMEALFAEFCAEVGVAPPETFTPPLPTDPVSDPSLYCLLGDFRVELGENEAAVEAYDIAIELDPDNEAVKRAREEVLSSK